MKARPIIRVRDLQAKYGETLILDRIRFDVYEREILAILGETGSGKSTLMKNMIGLLQPSRGEVIIDGDRITGADDEISHRILKKIGVLFQNNALFSSMTLAENVALPMREYTELPEQALNALVRFKLTMMKLDGYEHFFPAELSGGMKKRAALARAMALNPRILFFDEPSAGLDPISSAELDFLIDYLNRTFGTTMVLVTHELPSILRVAHRVIMLDKQTKGIIAEGDPHYLKAHSQVPLVRSFFNRLTEADVQRHR
jgi:phospholipid/cholesterol/gamma-HCH transport system ATP-binding protein